MDTQSVLFCYSVLVTLLCIFLLWKPVKKRALPTNYGEDTAPKKRAQVLQGEY